VAAAELVELGARMVGLSQELARRILGNPEATLGSTSARSAVAAYSAARVLACTMSARMSSVRAAEAVHGA
jgi:hypothetical protein